MLDICCGMTVISYVQCGLIPAIDLSGDDTEIIHRYQLFLGSQDKSQTFPLQEYKLMCHNCGESYEMT